MSYEKPFEEWQSSWLRRLSNIVGAEEGREIYILRLERDNARSEVEKLRKLIKDYLQAHDNRDQDHKDDFSHEAWNKYLKLTKDLRSVATQSA